MQREPEEAAVPEVVDLGPEIREDRRRRVAEVVEELDEAALLGDEDTPVRRRTGSPSDWLVR